MLGRLERNIRFARIQKKDFSEKKQLSFFLVKSVYAKKVRTKKLVFSMKGTTSFSNKNMQNICLRSGYRMGVQHFFRVNRHLFRKEGLRGKFLGLRNANW